MKEEIAEEEGAAGDAPRDTGADGREVPASSPVREPQALPKLVIPPNVVPWSGVILASAAALLGILGAMLPWASARAGDVDVTLKGTEFYGGQLSLLAALVLCAVLAVRIIRQKSSVPTFLGLSAAIIVMCVGIGLDAYDVLFTTPIPAEQAVDPGAGLFISLIAGCLAIAATVVEGRRLLRMPSSDLRREVGRMAFGSMLVLVLMGGFVLRFWGVSWDEYTKLHPDERFLTMVEVDLKVPNSIGQYFNSDESSLNPYNTDRTSFAYGTLPIFVTKLTGEVLEHNDFFPMNLMKEGLRKSFVGEVPAWNDYAHINLVGRLLSTLFDVATIYVVFLTGRLLFDRRVGLLAALLLSVTVLHVQLAHFFAVDSFLAFFAALAIYFSIKIVKFGRWSDYAWAGLCFGFAVACKLSGVFLGPVIALAVVQRAWPQVVNFWQRRSQAQAGPVEAQVGVGAAAAGELGSGEGEDAEASMSEKAPSTEDEALPAEEKKRSDWSPFLRPALGFLLMVFIAFLAFRVAQPYAFDGLFPAKIYMDDMKNNALLQSGGDFPPNWEWVGRASYLFPLANMVFWGMGLPLGIAACGALLWSLWRLFRHRDATNLLLVAWIIVFFGYWGRNFNPTMRYFLPVYPALVLLAAWALIEVWRLAHREESYRVLRARLEWLRPFAPTALKVAVAAVVGLTVFWALAFTNIYRHSPSRVQASNWITDNLPENAVLTCEHWDDCVPFGTRTHAPHFKIIEFQGYGDDMLQPNSTILDTLDEADYISISSNRLYGSIPRTPAKWPTTSKFYELLLAEKLDFKLVREFTSYPSFLGITIPDDAAEGNFTVYDHPKVYLFEKTDDYSRERLVQAVSDVCVQAPATRVTPANADQNALMMRNDDCATQREGGTWTSIFDPDSLTDRFPLLTWMVVIELMSLALLPIALVVFRSLPDRGYLLTKPLGLLAVSWLTWLGASVKLFEFNRDSIFLAFLAIIVVGGLVNRWSGNAASGFIRTRWRMVLLCEALFLGAFLAFYWIRIVNPDLWHPARGGEKPMELAYLNAVTRSTTMPPYDPWFAGGYLNYYYFGQFMTATMVKFSGVVTEVSFNIAVPMYFAMTVGAAYSVVYNLAEAVRQRIKRAPGMRSIASGGPVAAGVLGAVFVAIAGNLQGLYQTANRLDAVGDWHLGKGIPLISGFVGMLGGLWKIVTEGGVTLPPFDYWEPSRIMPPQNVITEFPFFTFLFADLHAHLMAIPFDIAIIGVGLALVLSGRASGPKSDDRIGGMTAQSVSWIGVVVLALLVGALRPINSWDYPPFLLLSAAAIVIGERAMADRMGGREWGQALLKIAALVGLSILFFYPFWQDYHLFYKGFHVSDETTPFHQYLAHFGLFLFAIVTLLAVFARRSVKVMGLGKTASLYVLTAVGALVAVLVLIAFSGVTDKLPITVKGLSTGDFLEQLFTNEMPVVALSLLAIAAAGLLAWREFRGRQPDAPVRLFLLAMVALAFALSAGVDVLTLDGDIGRMNTVFKFYVHVWLLLGIVSAFGVWYVFTLLRSKPKAEASASSVWKTWTGPKTLWAAFFVVLLGGALVYPISGTRARVDSSERFNQYTGHSVDGMEFMRYSIYGDEFGRIELSYDYDAIQWMRQEVEGSPVIVEANTPNYRWGARFSIYTGLPSVVGWVWHQEQQRGEFGIMVQQREKEVKDFYSTTSIDEAQAFLQRYKVSYVIVGQVERYYYAPEGMAKFDSMNGRELRLVYQNPEVQIYSVTPSVTVPSNVAANAQEP